MSRGAFRAILIAAALSTAGCAYTSKTNLPENARTVHVAKVASSIDITGDVTSKSSFKVYRPGLEVELRNALIERIIFDGHLKIASSETADAVLSAELVDFRRDPLRYNRDESIQEFRVSLTASVKFTEAATGRVLWESPGVAGKASYFLSGELARSEDEAVAAALSDLARQTVEGLIEIW